MASELEKIEAELRRVATNLAEIFHELEKYKPREPLHIWVNYYEEYIPSVFEALDDANHDNTDGCIKTVEFVEVIE